MAGFQISYPEADRPESTHSRPSVHISRNLQQPNVEMESPGAPPPRLIAAGKGNVPLINLRHYFSNQYSPSLEYLFVLAFSLPWLSLT
jgi:hypothetical protein